MTTAVKERPILYQGQMVCGILEDRKTQTRRLMKPQPFPGRVCGSGYDKAGWHWNPTKHDHLIWAEDESPTLFGCPYGKPGERLWVRETWRVTGRDRAGQWEQCIEYRADHSSTSEFSDAEHWRLAKAWADNRTKKKKYGWGTPIHMPRWASRILLEITAVSCERVQDISVEDVFAEGVQIPCTKDGHVVVQVSGKFRPADYILPKMLHKDYPPWTKVEQDIFTKAHYAALWDSINGVGSWESNPWVWRIAFKRIK